MTPEELRAYRGTHGLSQLQVADSLSTSPVTVSRWESGKLPLPGWLTLSVLERACEAAKSGAPLRWVH
jgi:transcriptional regulator with XRE-family HTH domain